MVLDCRGQVLVRIDVGCTDQVMVQVDVGVVM